MEKDNKVIKRIEDAISLIENKENCYYFFVSDCKNMPNSNMLYVYNMAYTLRELGYKVCLLYQLQNEYTKEELKKLKKENKYIDPYRQFEGVKEWLGTDYDSIPRLNISNGTWKISPSDFLFIPEAFASLMKETFDKKIPCKRYVILQNFKYVTEFIPLGDQWSSYGIYDVVASNNTQAKKIKDVFPYVKTTVINPFVPDVMRKPLKAKKLMVNVVGQKSSDVERIIKMFYWKYPSLNFLTFRSLRDMPTAEYADMLKECCITVWDDVETPFGYSAIDAIKCGNILIGRVPDTIPEWMGNEDDIKNNGVWYQNIEQVPDLIARVVTSWIQDDIPQELYDNMENTYNRNYSEWEKDIKSFVKNIQSNRKNEFLSVKNEIVNKNKTEETK